MKLKNKAIAAALVLAMPMATVAPAGAADNGKEGGLMDKVTNSSEKKATVSAEDKAYNEFAAVVKVAREHCGADAAFTFNAEADGDKVTISAKNGATLSAECLLEPVKVSAALVTLTEALAKEGKTLDNEKLEVAAKGENQKVAESGTLDSIKKALGSSDNKDGEGDKDKGSSTKLTSSDKNKTNKDGDQQNDGDNKDTLKTVGIVIGIVGALAGIIYAVTNFLPKPAPAPAPAPVPAPEVAPAPAVEAAPIPALAPVKGIAK